MATYYCDPSLSTGANDGTSIADAFQDGIEALTHTGAAAALGQDDEVIFRTHDGTSAISVSLGVTATIPAGIYTFDNGDVWANGGQFYLELTAHTQTIFSNGVVINAHYDAATSFYGLKIEKTYNSKYDGWVTFGSVRMNGVCIATAASVTNENNVMFTSYTSAVFTNTKWDVRATDLSGVFRAADGIDTKFINPVFDMQYVATSGASALFSNTWVRGANIEIFGGEVLNSTIFHSIIPSYEALYHSGIRFFIDGLDLGSARFIQDDYVFMISGAYSVEAVAADYTYFSSSSGGECKWLDYQNYPYLNALLPNSRGWSYRCLPSTNTTRGRECVSGKLKKRYTQTAAALTITAQVAINDAFTSLKKSDLYLEVAYVDDTTGEIRVALSPINSDALATSSVTWSGEIAGQPVYGAQNYTKYQVSLTTPTTVAQNSWLLGRVLFARPRTLMTDYWFVCPELYIT